MKRAEISWALLVVALVVPAIAMLRDGLPGNRGAELPVFGVIPSFSLVEQTGRKLTRADLEGRPWFADFVYTNCHGSCPTLSAEMAKLARRLEGRARLVSFSVDPARDTPETLTAYADRFGAKTERWLFVGGDVEAMRRLIREGFRLAVADAPADAGEPAGAITHSEKIVLVDASSRIRRYYDGGDGQWIEDALRDLDALGGSQATEARS